MGSVPGLTERIAKLLSGTLQKMLWWDDNYKRNANNDKDSVECFRSSGVVKIPRKILRKSSAPPFNSRDKIPISRKTSCPPLKKGFEGEILCQLEITEDLRDQMEITPNYKIQEPFRRVSVTKPRILNKKVETREPDFIQELRRGNMKEKWGLKLLYRISDGRVELCVEKVGMFSAGAKAGLAEGDILVQINGWKLEAMDNHQTAVSVFLAAGYN